MSHTMKALLQYSHNDALFQAHVMDTFKPGVKHIEYRNISQVSEIPQQLEDVLRISLTPRREILVPLFA